MKAILPCAGYGTRMSMLPTQSKEMLLDPKTNVPLIEYYFKICEKHSLTPFVITRKEKHDLISYLNQNGVDYMTIAPEGEWPTTVLSSISHWDERNFLFLPDTRFKGSNVIKKMKNNLDLGAESCFAIHRVDDVSKWGQIKDYSIIEKPESNEKGWAWGIASFNKKEGEKWLEGMNTRNHPHHLKNSSFVHLTSFKDITRTGKLESY